MVHWKWYPTKGTAKRVFYIAVWALGELILWFLFSRKLIIIFLIEILAAMGLPRWFLGGRWLRIHLPIQETQETWVWSLCLEDPLEEGVATHSSILVWKIPMDRGAWQAIVHSEAKNQTQLKWLSMHARHPDHSCCAKCGILAIKCDILATNKASATRYIAIDLENAVFPIPI